MINVTKSFLPPIEQYMKYVEGIWERCHLTNQGPLVNELEEKLKEYLEANHFYYVSNGTVALQLAIKALDLKNEIITTPFSYVATTSSIVWENAVPVFVDIDPKTLTIDVNQIEQAVTKKTTCILATHVYGIPCNVEAIENIAQKYGLKIIYDAAHAFGVRYKNKPLTNYGDISTLSFHSTKLFHTIEGGGIITNNDAVAHQIAYMRNFGHKGQEEFWGLGINGKNSEFHAAMGLCVLPEIKAILDTRRTLSETYDYFFKEMQLNMQRPEIPEHTEYNHAYYPVIFDTEKQLLTVRDNLNASFIHPRRYFYPSLNTLPYIQETKKLPVSEAISKKILCLPLYHDLSQENIKRICHIIAQVLKY